MFLISDSSLGQLFSFAPDQTIDLADGVPSSGIGAACQFHKEQYQYFAFPTLFCPIQRALQIILAEPQILLEKLDQLFFSREYMEAFLFRQSSFLFHLRKSHTLPFAVSFTFSAMVSRNLKKTQRLAPASQCLRKDPCPHIGLLNTWMCLRSRNSEWDSTPFASDPRLSCRAFQTHPTVVARSSRFVSRLPFAEGKLIGVCSLPTSMRDLGS